MHARAGVDRYVTPKPVDKAGHIIFCMDIPKPAGPGGQIISNDVERVMINRTKGSMGAQVCIETYSAGKTAEKGHTNDAGKHIRPAAHACMHRQRCPPHVRALAPRIRSRLQATHASHARHLRGAHATHARLGLNGAHDRKDLPSARAPAVV